MTKDEALLMALRAIEADGWCDMEVVTTAIKEALAQASDSVEKPIDFALAYGGIYKDQRAALAEALALTSTTCEVQPEQEPLAWVTQVGTLVQAGMTNLKTGLMYGWKPLYTAPPKREWVGLSAEDKEILLYDRTMPIAAVRDVTEAKLKELNHD